MSLSIITVWTLALSRAEIHHLFWMAINDPKVNTLRSNLNLDGAYTQRTDLWQVPMHSSVYRRRSERPQRPYNYTCLSGNISVSAKYWRLPSCEWRHRGHHMQPDLLRPGIRRIRVLNGTCLLRTWDGRSNDRSATCTCNPWQRSWRRCSSSGSRLERETARVEKLYIRYNFNTTITNAWIEGGLTKRRCSHRVHQTEKHLERPCSHIRSHMYVRMGIHFNKCIYNTCKGLYYVVNVSNAPADRYGRMHAAVFHRQRARIMIPSRAAI